ncbi:hypothetical protein ACWDA7_32960 [Streptomyces sp. NPDC001156]
MREAAGLDEDLFAVVDSCGAGHRLGLRILFVQTGTYDQIVATAVQSHPHLRT